jgi:predicted signal transduction protein with EAL and GGDEF domain
MTAIAMPSIPGGLLTLGAVALLTLVVLITVVQWVRSRRAAKGELPTPEDQTEAEIELHAIRRRLEVAKARAEIHRNGASLRQKIREELK